MSDSYSDSYAEHLIALYQHSRATARHAETYEARTSRIDDNGAIAADPRVYDPSGNLVPNRIWVRIYPTLANPVGRGQVAVWNTGAARVDDRFADTPVIVGYNKHGQLKIIDSDDEALDHWAGVGAPAPWNGPGTPPELLPGGGVTDNLRLYSHAAGTLQINARAGWYTDDQDGPPTEWLPSGSTALDISGSVPAAVSGIDQHCWVAIDLDRDPSAPALVATAGTARPVTLPLLPADIEDIALVQGRWRLGAIKLATGDTDETDLDSSDWVDTRYWLLGGASGTSLITETADVSNPPTLEDLETALGTAADLGDAIRFLRDTGTDKTYFVLSDGTDLLYTPLIKPRSIESSAFSTLLGAWTWFVDPRAVYYNGKTYIGYIGNNGHAYVAQYVHATGTASTPFDLLTGSIDDHNNPALLVRDSDKKLLVFYTGHLTTPFYYRISTNAEDATAWGAQTDLDPSFTGNLYSYAVPYQLLGEANDPIYLWTRDHYDGVNVVWAYSKSTDSGATFGALVDVYKNDGLSPYFRSCSNGQDRMDFATTDRHPNEGAANVYHFYYQGGNYYKTDGTQIAASLPLSPSDLTLVYSGATYAGWCWDIAYDHDANPVIVFDQYVGDTDHRYRYARWTGSAWVDTPIVSSGTHIGDEVTYAGGMCLDPLDPAVVYLSRVVSGTHEIYKYRTSDGGTTWTATAITSGSGAGTVNIRPYVPRNRADGLRVLWLRGTYDAYTDYTLTIYGSPI